jgi:hypothetical protein
MHAREYPHASKYRGQRCLLNTYSKGGLPRDNTSRGGYTVERRHVLLGGQELPAAWPAGAYLRVSIGLVRAGLVCG